MKPFRGSAGRDTTTPTGIGTLSQSCSVPSLDPWGRRARDDKETTTTSSPLDGIGCWTHEVIAHCAGFFGEPGVSSENRTWRSSENLEDLDKPAGDHLKAYCWRSSENLEDLFICQKGNEIRRDQTPSRLWSSRLSSVFQAMGFSDDTPGPPGILQAPPGCPGPPGYGLALTPLFNIMFRTII